MNVWVYLDSLFCSVGLFAYLYANTTWRVLVLRLGSFSKLFWHFRSFATPYKFQNQLVNFYKMPAGILTDITLNLEINVEFCDS